MERKETFWFVDGINHLKGRWFIVRLIPWLETLDFPYHLRYILVPAFFLEWEFLKYRKYYNIAFSSVLGMVRQGGYYKIDDTTIKKYENFCKDNDVIKNRKTYNQFQEILRNLFKKRINKQSDEYPYKDNIKRYEFYYDSYSDYLNKVTPDKSETEHSYRDVFLRIFALHVGQGDTFIVLLPNQNMYLIDMNMYSLTQNHIINIIERIKEKYDVTGIKGIIVTHKHIDHMRGLWSLISREDIEVKNLFINESYEHDSPALEKLYNAVREKKISVINLSSQLKIIEDDVVLDFVNPTDETRSLDVCADINDSSIVLKIVYGNTEMFFTGDAGYKILNKCCHKEKDTSFLKVSHHGSKTGTNKKFAKKLRPKRAFVPVGEKSRYKHPCAKVREGYFEKVDISYETRDVIYTSDGKQIEVASEF